MNANATTMSATTNSNQARLLTAKAPPTARITRINTIIQRSGTKQAQLRFDPRQGRDHEAGHRTVDLTAY